jgi:hypothetical protein
MSHGTLFGEIETVTNSVGRTLSQQEEEQLTGGAEWMKTIP